MRVFVLVAGVVVGASPLLLACSSLDAAGNDGAGVKDGGDGSTGGDGDVIVLPDGAIVPVDGGTGGGDGGTGADTGPADTGVLDPSWCGNDEGKVSQRCQFDRRCNNAECAKNSFLYRCFDTDGGTHPDVAGCRHMGTPDIGIELWCCPPKCAREKGQDGLCNMAIGEKAFYCPTDDAGPGKGLAATLPPPCRVASPIYSPNTLFCCP
jgi:hypothetical protein